MVQRNASQNQHGLWTSKHPRLKVDPEKVLDSFKICMEELGIALFTDLLPELPYTDECSGNYNKRTFFKSL